MAEAHKRKRHPKYKTKYWVKNWAEYKKSLHDRGDITVWEINFLAWHLSPAISPE